MTADISMVFTPVEIFPEIALSWFAVLGSVAAPMDETGVLASGPKKVLL